MGLGFSCLYLVFCLINKAKINSDVKKILQKQHISYKRYFTTPGPFQNFLWFVVAGNDSGYHVGFCSLFDRKKEIVFQYFSRNDSLLKPVHDREETRRLIRFSQQFYAVEKWNDTLVFNDLRFGQITGWQNPQGHFMFHYFLEPPGDNKLVVLRGRFQGWNRQTIRSFLKRIRGN